MPELMTMLNQGMRDRPGMYFGYPSLEMFYAFLMGYEEALDKEKADPEELEFFKKLAGFSEWLSRRYKLPAPMGWCRIIIAYNSPGQAGFNAFWKHFDEYSEGLKKYASKRSNGKR